MSCYKPDQFLNQDALAALRCPVNQGVLKNPIRDQCGHLACRECFQKHHQQKNGTCPVSGQQIGAAVTAAADVAASVDALVVGCGNPKEQCNWTGPLSVQADHIANVCPKTEIKCRHEHCEVKPKRENAERHHAECPLTVKKCQFCDRQGNDIEMEEHHNSDCQTIPIDCEKRCIVKHLRKNKALHDRFNCEKAKYDCYFRNAGCYFTGNWDEMGRHSSEALILHAQFLEQKLAHFQAYRAVTDKLLQKIKEDGEKYKDLQGFLKELDDTEDIDFPAFQGKFDSEFSANTLKFSDGNLLVESAAGNANQLLWLERKFHERHRLVVAVEKFAPATGQCGLAIGLARKGWLVEDGISVYNPAAPDNKENFKLFSAEGPNALSPLTMAIKAGADYMFWYDADTAEMVLEELDMKAEKPAELRVEFSTEFWEFQPVIILAGDVSLRLMDFNDWNQS